MIFYLRGFVMKNFLKSLAVCTYMLSSIICGNCLGMENKNSKGMFFYNVSAQQVLKLRYSTETDRKYDNDQDWLDLKSKGDNFCEQTLEENDLSQDYMLQLESESNYEKKAEAFEQAFFGNKFLYNKFRSLVAIPSSGREDLPNLRSEFLRWLIQNQKGNSEKAKSLVGLYKSLKNDSMYSLWKSIAIF